MEAHRDHTDDSVMKQDVVQGGDNFQQVDGCQAPPDVIPSHQQHGYNNPPYGDAPTAPVQQQNMSHQIPYHQPNIPLLMYPNHPYWPPFLGNQSPPNFSQIPAQTDSPRVPTPVQTFPVMGNNPYVPSVPPPHGVRSMVGMPIYYPCIPQQAYPFPPGYVHPGALTFPPPGVGFRHEGLQQINPQTQIVSNQETSSTRSSPAESEGEEHEIEVVDEHRVLIENASEKTPVDCIENFIESKTDLNIEKIEKGGRLGTFLVTFQEKPDVGDLKTVFMRRTIDDSWLKVSRVLKTTRVRVTSLGPKTTEDSVRYYFMNRKKSDGGNIKALKIEPDGSSVLINFYDPEVAERVCKREHNINGKLVSVDLFHPCLGEVAVQRPDVGSMEYTQTANSGTRPKLRPQTDHSSNPTSTYQPIGTQKIENTDIKRHSVFIKGVDNHVLSFLSKSSLFRNELSKYVKETFQGDARVITQPGNTFILVVECVGTLGDIDISAEIAGYIRNILRLTSITVPLPEGSLQQILDKIKPMLQKHDKFVKCEPVPGVSEITVYGAFWKVDSIKTEVLKIIKAEGNTKTRIDSCSLRVNQSRYLLLSKFADKFHDVKIEVCDTKVTFEGPENAVITAKTECLRLLNDLVSEDVVYKMTETMNLFDSSKTNEFVHGKLKDLYCTWECIPSKNCVRIYSETESAVFKSTEFLKSYISEEPILLDSSTEKVLSKPEWKEKKQELLNTFKGQLELVKEKKKLYLLCTADIRDIAKKDIEQFLQSHCFFTITIPVDSARARFIRLFKTDTIRATETKMQVFQLKVLLEEGIVCDEIRVSGFGNCCEEAEKLLRDMISKIAAKQHQIKLPGIEEFFLKGKGRELLVAVEQNQKCIIEAKQASPKTVMKEVRRWDVPGGGVLSIVLGDMRDLKVDAIVNAANKDLQHAGGVARAIVEKGGKEIQKESEKYIKKKGQLSEGQAVCTQAGSLPCKQIIHAVGPVWSGGGNDEETILSDTVKNILDEAEKQYFTSIAIPAISTGIFGFPVAKAVTIIMKALLDNWQPDDNSGLKQVYLCDIKKKTVDLFEEAGEKLLGKEDESDNTDDEEATGGGSSTGEEGPLKEDPLHSTASDSETEESDTETEEVEDFPIDDEDNTPGIKIVKRELADMTADVLVCPAQVDLDLQAGSVSRSLLTAGGQKIQTECIDKYGDGILLGELAETTGGNLKCKAIFHGLLKKWNQGSTKAEKVLENFVIKCLEQADMRKFKSIAFPALGTGNRGFPADTVASLMFQAARSFQEDNPTATVQTIFFVIHPEDRAIYKAFKMAEAAVSQLSHLSKSYESSQRRPISRRHRRFEDSEGQSHGLSYSVGPVSVEIVCGDITKETTDCVVNSCKESCDLSYSAISKALSRAAGYQLQEQCKSKRHEMAKSGFILTSGGNLGCKMVAHVKVQTSNWGWISVLTNCLESLNQKNISSASVPALGTGGLKQSPEKMAGVIRDAIEKFGKRHRHPKLRQIRIVIFKEEMVISFQSVFSGPGRPSTHSSHSSSHRRKSSYRTHKGSHSKSKHSRHASRPNDDVLDVSNRHIDDSVTLCIYTDDKKAAESAKERLTSLCKEEFDHKPLSQSWNTFIKKLNNKELSALYRIADEGGVALTQTQSGLALTGQIRLVSSAHEKIIEKLQNLEKLARMQEEARTLAKLVEWAYINEKGHSKLFTPGLNCRLEKAKNDKQKKIEIVDLKGRKYTVDLEKMVEYPQDGGKPITIRRIEKGGSSGLGKYVEGEREALAGSKTVYFSLVPERNFKGTAEDLHFRTAESQFYRLLSGQNTNYKVIKVEYVVNPQLVQRFRSAQADLKKARGEKESEPVLAFHGTNENNITNICEKGFLKAGDPGFQMKSGNKFGNGVYFSEYPDYSMGYISGATKLLLCKVLLGKTYTISSFTSGNVTSGYDSHTSSNGKELVIFDTSRILPCYIVHYNQTGSLPYM